MNGRIDEADPVILDPAPQSIYCRTRLREDASMEKGAAMSLKAIATTRKSEIDRIIDGIHGVEGRTLWTNSMRPSMRKDDPPEED